MAVLKYKDPDTGEVYIVGAPKQETRYTVVTMLAASWVDGAYSFEAQFPHAQYDIEVSVDESATEEQFDAFGEARIGSSATSNIAVARGEIPSVDIPVMVKAVRK